MPSPLLITATGTFGGDPVALGASPAEVARVPVPRVYGTSPRLLVRGEVAGGSLAGLSVGLAVDPGDAPVALASDAELNTPSEYLPLVSGDPTPGSPPDPHLRGDGESWLIEVRPGAASEVVVSARGTGTITVSGRAG